MSTKHVLWLSALSEYVQPVALAATLGYDNWPTRQRKRRRVLQYVANSLCNVVAADRRYPNEIRRHCPQSGHLLIDVLERRCLLNDADPGSLGIVDRLGRWLETHLLDMGIRPGRISAARVDVEYSASERTYLLSGRVWEMNFSLKSEIVANDQSFVAMSGDCTAAVPYGTGAIAW
ncbi:MAG: ferrous iron transport protein A [Gemmatimonadota bacterium]|nr:ferrous iron transport protein A [Gemmatimonadota bacterium]